MRAVFLISAKLHFILSAAFAPYRRGEIRLAMRLLGAIPQGALVLLDRNFNAWEFLLGIRYSASHFLIRAKNKMKGSILATLGEGDCLVEMKIPRALRRRFCDLPKTVVLRELTARIKGKSYRFFTTLLEPTTYTARELVELYVQRWEEEILLDGQEPVDARFLEHESKPAANGGPFPSDVVSEQAGAPTRRPQQRRQDPHRRRLAGAIRAKQTNHRAGGDHEIERVERPG
jgi:hypothetical protein